MDEGSNDHLVTSTDHNHPANLICTLCRNFYNLGWVTGTGGGTSIARDSRIFIAPSGVQKELMQPENIFVMDRLTHKYLRKPLTLKPSACTPLFLAAFDKGAGCCIHTHSQWAVLVTLLVEKAAVESGSTFKDKCFEIEKIEQIKGIPRGKDKPGMLGFFDRLRIPIIENTAHEEDLTQSLEEAMASYPDTYAVLVRRHGVYIWGDDVAKAKTQAESLDYIFRLAVEMRNLSLPWTTEEAVQEAQLSRQALEAIKGSHGLLGSDRGQAKRSSEGLEGTNIETPKKRRPGRPRKSLEGGLIDNSLLESKPGRTQLEAQNQFTTVNGVGNGVNGSAAKKGRGRPKKEVDPDDIVATAIPLHKAAKGRPGRPRRTL